MVGTRLENLVAFNDRLYAHNGYAVYQSTDEGVSWKKTLNCPRGAFGKVTTITNEESKPDSAHVSHFFNSKLITADNNLYLLSHVDIDDNLQNSLQIFGLSTDGNILGPVQSIPTFDEALRHQLGTGSNEAKEPYLSDGSEKEHQSIVSIIPPPVLRKDEEATTVVACDVKGNNSRSL